MHDNIHVLLFPCKDVYSIFMSYTLATLLFANPSMASGVARLFDFWGTFDAYNISLNPNQADARAIYSDWRTVGEQLNEAMEVYRMALAEENNQRERRVKMTTPA
jgi:hypothetical protein